ncbi:MAG TPA: hypothetical protein VM142_07270 [Acidimicrobiales bacterium]|nr:hypothetical protein [Acidimicrobiales bacterium]
MAVVLIDDHVLGAVLRGAPPPVVRRRELYTTGWWYTRLRQAVLASSFQGRLSAPFASLSAPFASLPATHRRRAIERLLALPDEIGIVALRTLGPVIGRQSAAHPRLNVLNREVLAAAVTLEADVVVGVGNEGEVLVPPSTAESRLMTAVALAP